MIKIRHTHEHKDTLQLVALPWQPCFKARGCCSAAQLHKGLAELGVDVSEARFDALLKVLDKAPGIPGVPVIGGLGGASLVRWLNDGDVMMANYRRQEGNV